MTEASSPNRTSVRLVITGKVQGVFYRNWMVAEASRRDLDGWVRNRADGSVEALLAGPAGAVDALIDKCRQGPPAAEVEDIEVSPAPDPDRTGFSRVASA